MVESLAARLRSAAAHAAVAGALVAAVAGCAATSDSDRIQQRADALIEADTTGGVVLAVVDATGATVGGAAGTEPDGTPIPLDGRFRIGSVTKTYVATVVLQLVEEGKLHLDDPAANDIALLNSHPEVTVRHLLSHTSGIADYVRQTGFWERVRGAPELPIAPEQLHALIADLPAEFAPGSSWAYSNSNYLYLGMLIEEKTGSSLGSALRSRIFEPLGLADTYFAAEEEGPPVVQAPIWIPDEGLRFPYPYTSSATSAWAAGAIVSNASDIGVFYGALFGGRLVGVETLQRMAEPAPGSAQGDPVSGYGLGLTIYSPQEYPNAVFYGHGGGVPGFQTLVWHHEPTAKTIVMVSTDSRMDFKDAALTMTEIVLAAGEQSSR